MVPVSTVNVNRRDELLRCLAALSEALDGVAAEVVVTRQRCQPWQRRHERRQSRLHALAAGHAGSAITFVGFSDAPYAHVPAADAVLVCSRYEAFGRVTIEAMLSGRPVVAVRSGATTELVRDGFNGLLYEPGDHADLADKVQYLMDHPPAARSMGENGKAWAQETVSRERYGAQLLDLLSFVVTGRRGPRVESLPGRMP